MPEPALAFLSGHRLHVRRNGVTEVLESEFERTVRERTASIERRNAWKMHGLSGTVLGGNRPGRNSVPAVLTGLTTNPEGALLYSMETDAISGVFLRDPDGLENRLFHTADFRIRHVALDPAGSTLAATAFHMDELRSNIAVLPVRGTEFTELTEGDSFDQLPRWVPGARRRIVFQSAGIGRDAAGRVAGLGASTIQRFDLDSGELDELAAEPGSDLMQPHLQQDGTLFYLRKPSAARVANASPLACLRDAVLFPFRMGRALFQYFNVFSMMYTGKPLVTSRGGLERRDPGQAFIQGNLMQAWAAQRQELMEMRAPSSWELVRQLPGGPPEVVARNVLAFDVTADGAIVHTDGSAISRLDPDGRSERLLQAERVERVLAL